jgi:hypothetical protein
VLGSLFELGWTSFLSQLGPFWKIFLGAWFAQSSACDLQTISPSPAGVTAFEFACHKIEML